MIIGPSRTILWLNFVYFFSKLGRDTAGCWMVCYIRSITDLPATSVMMDVCGRWVSCSHQGFKGILFAVADCRSSSLSYVMLTIFAGLVAEDWCQTSLAVNVRLRCLPDNLTEGKDWSSHSENVNLCLFSNKSFFMPPPPRWEHPILSWQWYGQSVFWAQFNILSDSILCQNWNYHLFPFTLSGFNTIQRKYEYFSFLSLISYSQLSVSNWRRGRDDLTQSPTFFFFAPLILPISFGLPAFSLSHRDWQLKIIAFIMCGVFIPSSSVFLFMREQKKKKKCWVQSVYSFPLLGD